MRTQLNGGGNSGRQFSQRLTAGALAELAEFFSAGRLLSVGKRRGWSRALSGALVAALASGALAGPDGAQVVRGDVNISRNGNETLIRAGRNSIINYRSFDIGRQETVRFMQPDARSRVLNRITGATPTRIEGSLLANGQVYIVNPAGVLFSGTARVDVNKLYAAAGNISNDDFVRGINRFTGMQGEVVNEGALTANFVGLLGKSVTNGGTINAPEGTVVMAAGKDMLVGERTGNVFVKIEGAADDSKGAALTNTGTINAQGGRVSMGSGDVYSMALRVGGRVNAKSVRAEAQGTGTVKVDGKIDASSTSGKGGDVTVTGQRVALDHASIDASGATGGGEVSIGGNFQGKGPDRNAERVNVSSGTTIKADATGKGDGGDVVVWSDQQTTYAGGISVRGGDGGGDGGRVEVSGKQTLVFAGKVDASAPAGKGGSLLLDPRDITIANGGGALITDVDNFADTGAVDVTIDPGTLDVAAATVTLQANRDISINDTLTLTNSGTGLTMQAGRSITINADISTTDGAVLMIANELAAAGVVDANRTAGNATMTFANGSTISTGSASITMRIDAGTGLTNSTSGTFTLGNIATSGAAVFRNIGPTGGSIVREQAGSLVTAGTVAMDVSGAAASVGAVGSPIRLAATNVEAAAGTGGVFLTAPTGGFTVGGVGALTGVSTTGAGAINISTNGTLTVSEAINSGSSTVTLASGAGDTNVNAAVTAPAGYSGSGAGFTSNASGTISTTNTALTINHTGAVTIGAALASGNGTIGVTGDSIAINGTITTAGDVTFSAATTVSQSAAIQSAGLTLGGAAIYTLTNAGNNIATLESNATGNISYSEAGSYTVGNAGGINGIQSGGANVTLSTQAGGTISVAEQINSSGGGVTVTADNVQITTGSIAAGAGAVSLTTDAAAIGGAVTGNGGITIRNRTAGVAIGLGGGAGALTLTTGDLGNLSSTGTVTIGRNDGSASGAIDAGALGSLGYSLVLTGGNNITLGGVTLAATKSLTLTAAGDVSVTGAVVAPGGFSSSGVLFGNSGAGTISTTNTGLTINHTGAVTIGAAVGSGNGTISVTGATIDQNAGVTTGGEYRLASPGAVSQTTLATAGSLLLSGAGTFALTNASNDFDTLASNATGAISVRDIDGIDIGTVNGVSGITSGGANATIQATAITHSQDVTLGAGTYTLNASTSSTQNAGADIVAASLLLHGAGTHTLTNANNDVDTLASDATGAISVRDVDGIDIGTVGAVNGITSGGANATIQAATITHTQAVSLGSGEYTLNASVSSGQGASITAGGLLLRGAGTHTLSNGGNDVDTLASDATGAISVLDVDGIDVGTVGGVSGITSGGANATIQATTITHSQDVSLGAGAYTLNAGTSTAQNAGADIVAGGLLLRGAGTHTLTNANNDVDTLASDATGAISVRDVDGIDIGTVGGVSGITSGGANATIQAATITHSQDVTLGAGTYTLNAGTSSAQNAGADIVAANLLLHGAGTHTLTNANNDVDTLASDATGAISVRDVDGIDIGTVGAVSGITSGGANATIQAATITHNQSVALGSGEYTLNASASSSQGAGADIVAGGLLLRGAGTHTLTNAGNDVDRLASDATGAISVRDTDDIDVGTVGGVSGITSSGANATIRAATITHSQDVTLGAGNYTLNAGTSSAQSAGADIVAAGLLLTGAGTHTLTNANNDVDTLASDATGAISVRDVDGIDIGTVGPVSGITSGGANATIQAATITHSQSVALGSGEYTLNAGTSSVQGAGANIVAGGLLLRGAGSHTLTAGGNDVDTLASDATGAISVRDSDDIDVGTVGGVNGITSGGANATIRAATITHSRSVALGSGEYTLNAGTSSAQNAGANIVAGGLLLSGAGTHTLTNAGNDFDRLASDATGAVSVRDTDDIDVGTVGGVSGITSGGANASIQAPTITHSQDVTLGLGTYTLNAGTSSAQSAGADIVALNLLLRGAGTHTLTNAGNDWDVMASDATGAISVRDADDIDVGTVGGVNGITSGGANASIQAGSITHSQAVALGAGSYTLNASAFSTQGASITAGGLLLRGAGNHTLTNAGNDVDTLASDATGVISVRDVDGIDVGTVGGVSGITSGGADATIQAATITHSQDVTLGAGTYTLNAGTSSTQNAGADIVAASLLLHGGAHTLTNANNDVDTLASDATGAISVRDVDGIDIGMVGAVSGIASGGANATIQAATITHSQDVNLGTGAYTLNASTSSTQNAGADIVAGGLLLSGAGTHTLTNAGNDVDTLASNATGAISVQDSDGIDVGTVGAVNGITSGGANASIQAATITHSQDVTLGAGTYTLNASTSSAQNAGADIVAGGLLLQGAGTHTLTNAGNSVDTLASDATGSISVRDADTIDVGTVGGVSGITSGGANATIQAATITHSQDVTLGAGAYTLNASASSTQTAGADIVADKLTLSGAGSHTLTNTGNDVAFLESDATGAIAYNDANSFAVGTTGGVNGVQSGGAAVTLSAGAGGTITIAEQINSGGGAVAVTADGLVVTGSVAAGAGAVTITTNTATIGGVVSGNGGITIRGRAAGRSIGLAGGAGDLSLDSTSLSNLDSTGCVTIGSTDPDHISGVLSTGAVNLATETFDLQLIGSSISTGGVTVNKANGNTLTLNTLSGGTFAQTGPVVAAGLRLIGPVAYNFTDATNDAGVIAAESGGGQAPTAFSYVGMNGLTIGTVTDSCGTTTGLPAFSSPVLLCADDLTIDAPITATSITLKANLLAVNADVTATDGTSAFIAVENKDSARDVHVGGADDNTKLSLDDTELTHLLFSGAGINLLRIGTSTAGALDTAPLDFGGRNFNLALTGRSVTTAGIATSDGHTVALTAAGGGASDDVTTTGDISAPGGFTSQVAGGTNVFGGDVTTSTGTIAVTGRARLSATSVTFDSTGDGNTPGHDIDFSSTIAATGDGLQGVTFRAGTGGNVNLSGTVGPTGGRVKGFTIASAASADLPTINAAGDGINLTGGTFVLHNGATTTGGGAFDVNNAGDLTIDTSPLTIDGAILQNAAAGGVVNLGTTLGSGATTGDAIVIVRPVNLTASSSATSGGGNVRFGSTLNGAQDFVASAGTGDVSFGGLIGNLGRLTSLTTTGANTIVQGVLTTGQQTYNSNLNTLGDLNSNTNGDITVNGSLGLADNGGTTVTISTSGNAGDDITITGTADTVTGAAVRGLTLGAGAGNVTLGGDVGSAVADPSISTFSATGASITTRSIRTSGTQNFNGLTAMTGSTNAGAGDINFNAGSTVSDNITGNNLVFVGDTSIGGNVTSTGSQTYQGAALLGSGTLLSADVAISGTVIDMRGPVTLGRTAAVTGQTSVTFGSTVASQTTERNNLTVNSPVTNFVGVVGGGADAQLGTLTTDANGTTTFNGDVTAENGITINDDAVIAASLVTVTSNNGSIAFGKTITSQDNEGNSLTVNSGGIVGNTQFTGNIGGEAAESAKRLGTLTTNANGTTFLPATIRTNGAQNYLDDVRLQNATTELTGTSVAFAKRVDSGAGQLHGLSVIATDTAGGVTFGSTVGSQDRLSSLTTNNLGTLSLAGDVTTSGAQNYGEANATLTGDAVLTGLGVSFAGNVDSNTAPGAARVLRIEAGNGDASIGGNAGVTSALASLAMTGVNVSVRSTTTVGAQTYNPGTGGIIRIAGDGAGNATLTSGTDINFNGRTSLDANTTVHGAGNVIFGGLVDNFVSGTSRALTVSNSLAGGKTEFRSSVGSTSSRVSSLVVTGDAPVRFDDLADTAINHQIFSLGNVSFGSAVTVASNSTAAVRDDLTVIAAGDVIFSKDLTTGGNVTVGDGTTKAATVLFGGALSATNNATQSISIQTANLGSTTFVKDVGSASNRWSRVDVNASATDPGQTSVVMGDVDDTTNTATSMFVQNGLTLGSRVVLNDDALFDSAGTQGAMFFRGSIDGASAGGERLRVTSLVSPVLGSVGANGASFLTNPANYAYLFGGSIGSTTQLKSFTIGNGGTGPSRIAAPVVPNAVFAEFNADGTIPSNAQNLGSSARSVTINVGDGGFNMERSSKLTTFGNLTISSAGNVLLGDLTSTGNLTVDATGHAITFLSRAAAPIIDDTGKQQVERGQAVTDKGVDVVAKGSVIFKADTITVDKSEGTGTVFFANDTGDFITNSDLVNKLAAGDRSFAAYEGGITAILFNGVGGSHFAPVDLQTTRSDTNISTAIAGAIPRDQFHEQVVQSVAISQAFKRDLHEIGLDIKDIFTSDEVTGFLVGRSLYDDVTDTYDPRSKTYMISVGRLSGTPLRDVLRAWYDVRFGPDAEQEFKRVVTQDATIQRATEEYLTGVQEAFNDTWSSYKEQAGDQVSGEAYRSWLQTKAQSGSEDERKAATAALDTLQKTNVIFDRLKVLALSPGELKRARAAVANKLAEKTDMTPEQFMSAMGQTQNVSMVTR